MVMITDKTTGDRLAFNACELSEQTRLRGKRLWAIARFDELPKVSYHCFSTYK
jgi:hypothetical protein